MAQSIYVASVEGHTAKSVVALGVLEALKLRHKKIGVFRAVVPIRETRDRVLELLLANLPNKLAYESAIGVIRAKNQNRIAVGCQVLISLGNCLESLVLRVVKLLIANTDCRFVSQFIGQVCK